ncbi:hypothetical protein NOR_05518 [Metarhizium rileyi]|uniref:Uncharacterized protein n=1 Tax=Metarhizium rileyi (strain RCEF 4871) TaxID=1649241 RepID=A0A167C9P6_METRR|nr:hypothetical protein NOR_05518 [Metarhizium rileyi RCEF 4871]
MSGLVLDPELRGRDMKQRRVSGEPAWRFAGRDRPGLRGKADDGWKRETTAHIGWERSAEKGRPFQALVPSWLFPPPPPPPPPPSPFGPSAGQRSVLEWMGLQMACLLLLVFDLLQFSAIGSTPSICNTGQAIHPPNPQSPKPPISPMGKQRQVWRRLPCRVEGHGKKTADCSRRLGYNSNKN